MRRLIATLIALLSLPGIALAAFAIFQTYQVPTVPQIFYNIVTDGGAQCSGLQEVTKTVSITSATNSFTVTTDTFTGADVGKYISIPGAGDTTFDADAPLLTTITAVGAFSGTQTITLAANAITTLMSASKLITYGVDDAWAFRDFNAWARLNQTLTTQVALTIPTGAVCFFATSGGVFTPGTTLINAWVAGIHNVLVDGPGARIVAAGGSGFFLGGQGIIQVGLNSASGKSARVQTVAAGASQIALTSASFSAGYISRFTVGKVIMIGGSNPQSYFQSPYGFPPNFTFFEWRTIANVNAGTGVIDLDQPLTNSYSDQWPEYNQGSNFEADPGGPATIYAINDTWDMTAEYRGAPGNPFTISQRGQTYAGGRHIIYRDVVFTGAHGGIPSQNVTWSAINVDYGFTNMETDKLVGTMLMDGVTIAQIVNQSSSTDLLIMRNSTVTSRLDGGAKRTEITDSTLGNFGPGIWAYGNTSGATICTRCAITTLNFNFNENFKSNPSPSPYTMSSGIITMSNSFSNGATEGARTIVTPDSIVYYLASGFSSLGTFQIQTVTADPWPALDNQTTTTTINITSASKNLNVPSGPFVSGDVGKTIIVNGAGGSGGQLRTFITAYSSATDVTLFDAAGTTVSSSQTIQWGTSNTYAQTNQAGGFPNISTLTANPIGFMVLTSSDFTCDACTGDPNAVGASTQAGAPPGIPLGSFLTRTYTPTTAPTNLDAFPSRGKIVSLTIDVTQEFVGTGTAFLTPLGQFFVGTINQATWTQFNWSISINLKQPGTRVITPSGVTCNGVAAPTGCAGDSLGTALPNAVWIQKQFNPWTAGNFSGMTTPPTFTMTAQTDQSP